MEPVNLIEWVAGRGSVDGGRLYSCGRPGRATFSRQRVAVPVQTIDKWYEGLPPAGDLHLVSLLGWKKDGYSEFEYYPFRSVAECNSKPTFEYWLSRYRPRLVFVHEFPTTDALGIPAEVLLNAVACVKGQLVAGQTVIVVDSAGAERTARVCEKVGFRRMR